MLRWQSILPQSWTDAFMVGKAVVVGTQLSSALASHWQQNQRRHLNSMQCSACWPLSGISNLISNILHNEDKTISFYDLALDFRFCWYHLGLRFMDLFTIVRTLMLISYLFDVCIFSSIISYFIHSTNEKLFVLKKTI